MRIPLLLLLIPFLVGCENFETKKISSEEVLDQETRTLNWKEVDEYPAFENCKNITELQKARNCFETTLGNSVYAYLEKQEPVVTEAIDDTVILYLKVEKTGRPAIDSILVDTTVTNQLPDIRLWLQQSVDSLPKIYPASKRGIPVSSTYRMPIVIRAEEN
jgi:hypothetical protein